MKLSEVKPLVHGMADALADGIDLGVTGPAKEKREQIRIALEQAFVAGVRSGLKYTSNAKFAELFAGKTGEKK